MRAISKGKEPRSLVEHRSSSYADYDNYTGKDALRASITAEQRGLCCYCLSRIPGERGMKIEHWRSQHYYRARQLDYSNLLGACLGNEGPPAGSQHCDTRKGDRELSRCPADPGDRVEDLIRYRGDGSITSIDSNFDRELNEVLNLNETRLRENRKATLDAFVRALPKSGRLNDAKLKRWLRFWNGELDTNDLQPFCQVVIYWLRKRLARN